MSFRRTLHARLPFHLTAIAACALIGCGGDDTGETPPPKGTEKQLVVLFTSDEHSHVFSFSPELDDFHGDSGAGSGDLIGGVARRAGVLAKERKAAKDGGKDSITVSAGDNQMGALPHVAFETASVDYGTMVALGYDVTTFGNHEFDFGPGSLAKSLDAGMAGDGIPPIVATNIHFSDDSPDDDELAKHYSEDATDNALVHPYRVITTEGGLKVGVIGWVGVNAENVAPNKTPVQFSAKGLPAEQEGNPGYVYPNLYADLQPVVDKLRDTEKVDVVIGLSHAGVNDTSSDETTAKGEDYRIAANVTGIDLIVSGHAHNADPKPIIAKSEVGGADTLILNAGSYGRFVGRVELTVGSDGKVTWNDKTQALVPVDDTTPADADLVKSLDGLVSMIEKSNVGPGSYLESLLAVVEGMPVTDDASTPGDLYFHPIGATAFDVIDTHAMEALSADAMLAAADAWAVDSGKPTDLALESAGVIRGVLKKGKTGVISAADAFSVVPLGASPVNGSLGYPLARAHITHTELRAVMELALNQGLTNSDYDILPAGLQVEFDPSREPIESALDLFNDAKGRVMRMLLDTDHSDGIEQYDSVIYDRVQLITTPNALISVVTSSYIAQFASQVGAALKDEMGKTLTLEECILLRTDQSEIKQTEAFFGFIKASPGGTLPDRYDVKSANATKRFVCIANCP